MGELMSGLIRVLGWDFMGFLLFFDARRARHCE